MASAVTVPTVSHVACDKLFSSSQSRHSSASAAANGSVSTTCARAASCMISSSSSSSSSPLALSSSFLTSFDSASSSRSHKSRLLFSDASSTTCRVRALFGFSLKTDSQKAGIYGSQGRDEFSDSDVGHYYEYMGLLAVEGSYDKVQALLDSGVHPADCLILLASAEGDVPKIKELMAAGADIYAKDLDGRNALERAENDDIRKLLLSLASSRDNKTDGLS